MKKLEQLKRKIDITKNQIIKKEKEIKKLKAECNSLELEESFYIVQELKKEFGENLSLDELILKVKGVGNE